MSQWDEIYQSEGIKYSSSLKYWSSLIRFFQQNDVDKVLDLGCGSGKHLLDLAKKGFRTYGLDVSQKAIYLAKQTFSNHKLKARFQIHSMHEKLPYPDNYFDATISLRTINHGTINQIKMLIEEIKRIIRPGGYIFITTLMIPGRKKRLGLTTLNSLSVKMIEPRTFIPLEGKETGVIHYIFNKEILLRVFSDFQIIKFWIEYGQKKWERYYCLLAQKPT